MTARLRRIRDYSPPGGGSRLWPGARDPAGITCHLTTRSASIRTLNWPKPEEFKVSTSMSVGATQSLSSDGTAARRLSAKRIAREGVRKQATAGNLVFSLLCAAVMSFYCWVAGAQTALEVTAIGTLGGNYSKLLAISPNGQWACGESSTNSGQIHAVRYHVPTSTLEDLGAFNGANTTAVSINDSGVVAANVTVNGRSRAATLTNPGQYNLLPYPNQGPNVPDYSEATAINREGDVVGKWNHNNLAGPSTIACIWYSGASAPTTLVDGYPGSAFSVAISNRYRPIGSSALAAPWCVYTKDYAGQRTWIKQPGQPSQALTFPGTFYPQGADVNERGEVLGYNSNLQFPNTYSIWYRYQNGSNKEIGYGSVRRMAENGDVLIGVRSPTPPQSIDNFQIIRADGFKSASLFTSSCTFNGVTSPCLGGMYKFDLRDISEHDTVVGSGRLMQAGLPERGVIVRLATRCRPPTYADVIPMADAIIPGQDAVLECLTDAAGLVKFTWKRYGIPIDPAQNATATTARLTISAVSELNSGEYTCEVANECGFVASTGSVSVRLAARHVIQIDPRGTHLYASPSRDPGARWATIIELSRFGIAAGDRVRFTRLGFYEPNGDPLINYDAMVAVFSPSGVLLPAGNLNRVPDALACGFEFVTAPSFGDNIPTDIPHDMYVGGQEITVPTGATHVFAGPHDIHFGDNTDYNNDYRLELVNMDPDVQPCSALTLSAASSLVARVTLGESAVLSTTPTGSGPYNYRWTVSDPTYPTGWRPLEDGTYFVGGIAQFLVRGATERTLVVTPLVLDPGTLEFMGSVGNPCALGVSPVFTVYTCAGLQAPTISPTSVKVPLGQSFELQAVVQTAEPVTHWWERGDGSGGWVPIWRDGYVMVPSTHGGPTNPGEKPVLFVEGAASNVLRVTLLDPVYAKAGAANFRFVATTQCASAESASAHAEMCDEAPSFALSTPTPALSVALDRPLTVQGRPQAPGEYLFRWEVLDTFGDPAYPVGQFDYKWRSLSDGMFVRNGTVQFDVSGSGTEQLSLVPRVAPANWAVRLAATLRDDGGGCTTAFSYPIAIVPCASVPLFQLQPRDAEACAGGEASFAVSTVDTSPYSDGTLYDWQMFTTRGGWRSLGVTPITVLCPGGGEGSASLSETGGASVRVRVYGCASSSQYLIRCVISNACGSMSSNFVRLSACPADLNCDGFVDDTDFVYFTLQYDVYVCDDPAMPLSCYADLNSDGVVDEYDFVLFAGAYEQYLCP